MAYDVTQFFADLYEQQAKLDKLVSRVGKAINTQRSSYRDGDRKTYYFVESIVFPQQDDTSQNIVFTVPEGQEFFAERLAFYPSFRFTTTDPAADGPAETFFKPCVFTSYEGVFNPRIETDQAAVDCFVSIAETYYKDGRQIVRALQNMPTPVQLFYSGAVNYRRGGRNELPAAPFNTLVDPYYASFEFPTAHLFSVPWYLPGGSSATISVAPSFAGVREDPANTTSTTTRQNEYRITAVLSGFKRLGR